MPDELILPIADISLLAKTAKKAALTRSDNDRPGHTRRVAVTDKVLTTIDEHPWGDVIWALYPSRYLEAQRNWHDGDVWRYFQPVRLTVRDPRRTVRRDHAVRRLRNLWPDSRGERKATGVGVGAGATLAGATLAIDQLAGPIYQAAEFSLFGISAMTPLIALLAYQTRGARTAWLIDDNLQRQRIPATRGLSRNAPAMPPEVLAAIAAAANAWQYVIGLEHKPAGLLDHLQTLHERMYELMGSAPQLGHPVR